MPAVCRTSTTKRRTKAEITAISTFLYEVLEDDNPQTIRHLFYRTTGAGLIDKTEGEYRGTICRLLSAMRSRGEIPYSWLSDNTRWMRKPTTYRSLKEALEDTSRWYRRDLFAEQDAYVEVWTEKDAIAGILSDVTYEWDVPLMVSRGFSSLSFLYSAAEKIKAENKTTFLYYFGDFDPSGMMIPQKIESKIRGFAPDVDLQFVRVAVNEKHISDMDLPTRPTKKAKNTHAANFKSRRHKGDRSIYPGYLRIRGRPRGRNVKSRPSLSAHFSIQAPSPYGRPRVTLRRIASSSASVWGRLTSFPQSRGQGSGQVESRRRCSAVPHTRRHRLDQRHNSARCTRLARSALRSTYRTTW